MTVKLKQTARKRCPVSRLARSGRASRVAAPLRGVPSTYVNSKATATSANPKPVDISEQELVLAHSFLSAAVGGHLGSQIATAVRSNSADTKKPLSVAARTRASRTNAHDVMAPWHAIDGCLRFAFAHLALASTGPVLGFSVQISEAVRDQAFAKGRRHARNWFERRLRGYLNMMLGRPVSYSYRIEIGKGLIPFIRLDGEIDCAAEERSEVGKALRRVGGWRGNGSSIATRRPDGSRDSGWQVFRMILDPNTMVRKVFCELQFGSWESEDFVISRDLKIKSRAIYRAVRMEVRL